MDKLITQAHELLKGTGISYAICGGHALALFAGKKYRDNNDIDITIMDCHRHKALQFLAAKGWGLYARYVDARYIGVRSVTDRLLHLIDDPTSAEWDDCDKVSAVLPDSHAKPVLIERAGVHVFKFEEPRAAKLDYIKIVFDKPQANENAILHANGVPYLAPELVLYIKTPEFYSLHPLHKSKTELDFKTIMPLLPSESREWLLGAINAAYPCGHKWLMPLL